MRTRLTLFLLLAGPVWSGLARADQADRDRDPAVARADAGFAVAASPSADTTDVVGRHEAPILKVISSYGRALETQDVALFRSVMPGLGPEAETRLRQAFRSIDSQQVRMTVESVDVEGPIAVVRVRREDTVDGHRMTLVEQSFHLVRRDGGWRIDSMSFHR